MLTEEQLRAAHAEYQRVRSLNHTCRWIQETFGVRITRHQLSPLFHRYELHVFPPNGKPVHHYRPFVYMDAWNELAADWVKLIWQDVVGYLNGGGVAKIHFMSACAAFNAPLYRGFLNRLNANVTAPHVTSHTLPQGVRLEDLIRGREMYDRGYQYWVEAEHDY